MSDGSFVNTDQELWREPKADGSPGDYYSPRIHVTQDGGIGIDVGGTVIVMPLRQWHSAAAALLAEREKSKRLADILGQMSTSCVPPLHNCGTCMRARAALSEAGEE